ncbi:hypothetical protein C8J57DRAFT_1466034 [Mycena rebaudengoi]|nr:hypothetical protein C8J57DRAFT_1466034 [Mycena rebaudengoi]
MLCCLLLSGCGPILLSRSSLGWTTTTKTFAQATVRPRPPRTTKEAILLDLPAPFERPFGPESDSLRLEILLAHAHGPQDDAPWAARTRYLRTTKRRLVLARDLLLTTLGLSWFFKIFPPPFLFGEICLGACLTDPVPGSPEGNHGPQSFGARIPQAGGVVISNFRTVMPWTFPRC